MLLFQISVEIQIHFPNSNTLIFLLKYDSNIYYIHIQLVVFSNMKTNIKYMHLIILLHIGVNLAYLCKPRMYTQQVTAGFFEAHSLSIPTLWLWMVLSPTHFPLVHCR